MLFFIVLIFCQRFLFPVSFAQLLLSHTFSLHNFIFILFFFCSIFSTNSNPFFLLLGGGGGGPILCLDSMPEDVKQNKFSFLRQKPTTCSFACMFHWSGRCSRRTWCSCTPSSAPAAWLTTAAAAAATAALRNANTW